jgi:hypothetical protein
MCEMSSAAPKIIGGMFGMELPTDPRLSSPPFLTPHSLLTANARSAVYLVANLLKPARVWLPSYICGTILPALEQTAVHFYPVRSDLSVPEFQSPGEGDLVIIVDYFGVLADRSVLAFAKSRGAWVLEDACQALLTEGVGEMADFLMFSPRKFLGVPDGGILTARTNLDTTSISLSPPPPEWALKTLRAGFNRWKFDVDGGDRCWFTLFQETERDGPVGNFAISDLASLLLRYAFDYSTIARKRRENYVALEQTLGEAAVFPVLSPGEVPLGFPVRLKRRDTVRAALFDQHCYPTIHWPIDGVVPPEFAESHELSQEILTLPCDQRYSTDDMRRLSQAVLGALAIV